MPEEGPKNGEEVLQPDWQVVFRDELTALQKNGANHLPDELIDDEAARERTPPCRSPAETGDNYLTGICLSGGGIRSALVSLGAMERLAKSGILSRFDYLSTVSGGGYAGSAMSYFWAMKNKPDIKTKNPAWAKADHPFDVGNDAIDSIRRDYRKGLQAIEKRYSEDLAYADKHPRQTGTAGSNTDDPTNADHNDGLSPTDRRDAAREKLFQETLGRKALLKLGTEGAWNRTEADTFAARYMSHLRTHVNYLMPKGAIDALRGGYVVARAILLNLFIWIILGAGLIELLQQVGIWINRPINVLPFALLGPVSTAENAFFGLLVLLAAILAVGFAIMMFAYSLSSYLVASETPSDETGMARSVERRALWIFSGAIGLTALVTWWISQPWGLFAAGAIVVAVLAYLFLAGSFATANDGERRNAGHKYRRRRFYERYAGKALLLLIVFSVIGLTPVVADNLNKIDCLFADCEENSKQAPTRLIGFIVSLIGVGSGLYGYARDRLDSMPGLMGIVLFPLGAATFIYGAILLAYLIAWQYWESHTGIMVGFTIVAGFLAWFVNINDVSLGRFYRDRLMETFMPDPEIMAPNAETDDGAALTQGMSPAAAAADQLRLVDLAPSDQAKTNKRPSPLHLVCCNVVAGTRDDAKAQRRFGDSFVLSELYCGSDTTQWRRTSQVARGNLRLATAMGISGAAANPRSGFAGTGPTTGPVVSFAMAMLSLRLGYWLRWDDRFGWFEKLNPFGNHISPGLLVALGRLFSARWLTDEITGFREITDGGHFENLGLYELVRRRCGLIVVCDGGQDPSASYASFTAAQRRIEEDFGARIEFDVEIDQHPSNAKKTDMRLSGPQDIVMRTPETASFPKDVEFAPRGYFLATIQYSQSRDRDPKAPGCRQQAAMGPEKGLLIYLKSTMLDSLKATTKGYRGANEEFPFDPTSNQFFSSVQFEAYRDVGWAMTEQMLSETLLERLFDGDRPTIARLLNNYAFGVQRP